MMFATGNLHKGFFQYGPQMWVAFVSFAICGGFLGLLVTCSFPEMADMVESIPELKNCDDEKKNAYLAGLFNLLASIAECAAPLTAGFTTNYFGYERAYFMAGVFTVIFGLIYYFVCGFGKWVDQEKTPVLYEIASEKNEKCSRSESATKYKSSHPPQDEEASLLGRKTV